LPEIPAEEYLDSGKYPVRIHYPSGTSNNYIEAVLNYVEHSYQKEVDEIGFIAPPPDGSSGGSDYFDIYFRELQYGLGGYTAPTRPYRDVDWFSYASYCVVNIRIPDGEDLQGTIAHEFNHACQFSMDASETLNIMEATATYIMDVVFPGIKSNFVFLPYFQREPQKSIDYYDRTSVYVYGAFLFPRFLSEFYDHNSPTIIRKIWEGTRQKGWTNEPDYLDVIESLVSDYAGHDLRDTYREFAKWRYFTGPNDDGDHFIRGAEYGYLSQVKIDRTFTASSLPLIDWSTSTPPSEFGSTYLDFDLDSLLGGLFLQFKGEPMKSWSADMIMVPKDNGATEYRAMIDMMGHAGTLFVPQIQNYDKTVLVISNLSDGEHDPDYGDWESSNFSLNAEAVVGPRATVFTDRKYYSTGENFKAEIITMNAGEKVQLDLLVVLESGGVLYFYPRWMEGFAKVSRELEMNSFATEPIFDFIIEDANISGHFVFYTALLDKDSGELIGELDKTYFSINIERPKAVLKVYPPVGNLHTIFTVDASESYDPQNPKSVLKTRWDWENDGLWDTPYSTRKVEYHFYDSVGLKTIRLEVLDLDGFNDQTTQTVEVINN